MIGKEHTHECRICHGPTVAGTTVCPACEEHTDRYMNRNYPGEYRLVYDNPSHDGAPVALRFISGPFKGQTMRVVTE